MMYVDLGELPGLFDRFLFWSARRFNLAWFRRADHLGNPDQPLIDSVRRHIENETGFTPAGSIRLLTHFRYFGHGFNPVSFYYCFDAHNEKVEAVVAEVNNTPWGEQHIYVLPARDSETTGEYLRFRRQKEFHVSPYMPMDIDYDWRFFIPGERLTVHMENYQADGKLFDATLQLQRTTLSSANLARVLISYPLITVKVVIAIYFEALKLWLKKIPFCPHPIKKEAPDKAKNA